MKQKDILSKAAQKKLGKIWGQLSQLGIDEARDILINSMVGLVGEYGDTASLMTAEFMARYSPNTTRFEYLIPDAVNEERIEHGVRSAMNYWAKGVPESTIKQLYGALDRYIRDPSKEMIVAAAKKHKKVRFAIVPRPGCACEYCLMYASRGFVYWSKETAKASLHVGCKCEVLQGFKFPDGSTTEVEGYNPEMLERRWRHIRDGNIKIQSGAAPLDKELDVGVFLADAGHKVKFIREEKFARTADTFVDGVRREFKVPEGNSSRATNWRTNAMSQLESVLYDKHGNLKPQAYDALISIHKVSDKIDVAEYQRFLLEAWNLEKCSTLKSIWLANGDGRILYLSK